MYKRNKKCELTAGTTYEGEWDDWYGPSGRDSNYTYSYYQMVVNSPTSLNLQSINYPVPNKTKMANLRRSVDLQCQRNGSNASCKPLQEVCLFNIRDDPCEIYNVRFWVYFACLSLIFMNSFH